MDTQQSENANLPNSKANLEKVLVGSIIFIILCFASLIVLFFLVFRA